MQPDKYRVDRCSFCRKTATTVDGFITSPGDYLPRARICTECVAISSSVLREASHSAQMKSKISAPDANYLLTLLQAWLETSGPDRDNAPVTSAIRAAAASLFLK